MTSCAGIANRIEMSLMKRWNNMTSELRYDPRMAIIDMAVEYPDIFSDELAHKLCDDIIEELDRSIREKQLREEYDPRRYMMAHAYLHKRVIYRRQGIGDKVEEMYDKVKEWNPNEKELIEPRELLETTDRKM
jgi:hypothetical protein